MMPSSDPPEVPVSPNETDVVPRPEAKHIARYLSIARTRLQLHVLAIICRYQDGEQILCTSFKKLSQHLHLLDTVERKASSRRCSQSMVLD